MKQPICLLILLASMLLVSAPVRATEKDDEIRKMMWNEADPAFRRTEIPDKWANESAVIISQMRKFYYRKPPIIAQLQFHKEFHNRIKLADKKAVEEYAELSFLTTTDQRSVHVGFKIIKPGGEEIVIDPETAVLMEREGNGESYGYKKIAIPNLEPGDILDYYIYEEHAIPLNSQMFYFDPVLYHLPQGYPVISQKLEFHIQRRCFVSLRSLNGAPELQVKVDEENDEQIYYLEDTNREAVKDVKWFYPYRELPAVKFRAAYMSGKGQRSSDMLIGEPGEVKGQVSKKELADFVAYMLNSFQTDARPLIKHVKKNVSKDAGNFEKARSAYYFYRNSALQWAEVSTVSADQRLEQGASYYVDNRFQFLDKFSAFLAGMDIPYDIVMAIPREISSLDDLLLEQELQFLFRVKEGNDYLYFTYYDAFRMPGEIPAELQGTEAYYVDGLAKFAAWNPQRLHVPLSDAEENVLYRQVNMDIASDFKSVQVQTEENVSGLFKSALQTGLLDFYDYEQEEKERYEMKEDFEGTLWMKKKLLTLRGSYKETREKKRLEVLEGYASEKYDFEIDDVRDFQVKSTGRYEEDPNIKFSYGFTTDALVSQVGPNYLIEIGRMIEEQVKIDQNELDRKVGIYMPAQRTYQSEIRLKVPSGYEVKGLEELNSEVKNEHGTFVSTGEILDGVVVIKTKKAYTTIHAEASSWPDIVSFLNAAHDFYQKKILFKKE